MLNKILLGSILVLLIGLSFTFNLYSDLLKENSKLEDQVEDYQFKIEEMKDKIISYSTDMRTVRETSKKISIEYLDTVKKLNQYKNRENIIAKKPGLVSIKIQKSFDEYVRNLECLTGNPKRCINE